MFMVVVNDVFGCTSFSHHFSPMVVRALILPVLSKIIHLRPLSPALPVSWPDAERLESRRDSVGASRPPINWLIREAVVWFMHVESMYHNFVHRTSSAMV